MTTLLHYLGRILNTRKYNSRASDSPVRFRQPWHTKCELLSHYLLLKGTNSKRLHPSLFPLITIPLRLCV